jgi:hypothetical protein
LDGGPSGEQVIVLRALVASARAGVGGPLRTNYLLRRLALETKEEVFIDDPPVEAGRGQVGMPRSIGLTEMQALIHVWQAREGLASDSPRAIGANRSGDALTGAIGRRHDDLDQVGRPAFVSATILPF